MSEQKKTASKSRKTRAVPRPKKGSAFKSATAVGRDPKTGRFLDLGSAIRSTVQLVRRHDRKPGKHLTSKELQREALEAIRTVDTPTILDYQELLEGVKHMDKKYQDLVNAVEKMEKNNFLRQKIAFQLGISVEEVTDEFLAEKVKEDQIAAKREIEEYAAAMGLNPRPFDEKARKELDEKWKKLIPSP